MEYSLIVVKKLIQIIMNVKVSEISSPGNMEIQFISNVHYFGLTRVLVQEKITSKQISWN